MRNVFLTVAFVVATFVCANAQFYAGGSLGFENNSDLNPKSSLWFNPEIGYYITKKFDVGLDVGFSTSKQQNDANSTYLSFAPFARYSFYQLGRFEVLVKGSAGFNYVDSPIEKYTSFRMHVSPLLTYNLTEKIVLFTQLNFLSFSFVLYSPDEGDYSHHFRFGASNSLLDTGSLPIGFFYKF